MMYQDHFGLTCNPFRHAPSAEFFFAGRNHREALAALQWALSDPTGMALLTGDVGTGKTTVVRELFSRETRNLRAALVTNPRLGFDGMLESILHQLRLECPEERSAMLRALAQAAENLRVVIVIDEAQRLSDDALEEFRLLSNSSPENLQLMLVGQPELLERLSSPALRQLNQRIATRAMLAPLGSRETIDYIEHRIRAAGGDPGKLFSRAALRAIARNSAGIPRRANILSHNAMLLAYGAGLKRTRARHAVAAAREYDQSTVPRAGRVTSESELLWRLALAPALLLAAGVAFTFFRHGWVHRSTSHQHHTAAVTKSLDASERVEHLDGAPVVDSEPAKAMPSAVAAGPSVPEPIVKASAKQDATFAAHPGPAEASLSPETQRPRAEDDSATKDDSAADVEVVVSAGDTLSDIAQRHSDSQTKIDVHQLLAANPEIKDPNLIYPGERVRLKSKMAGEVTP